MNNPIIFIMGVSGSGKSTIGNLLSGEMNIPFFDGDDFHPVENIKKMESGTPLNDKDRKEWLKKLNEMARNHAKKEGAIIACSALKESYRKVLENGIKEHTIWVILQGNMGTILSRLKSRENHYMPASLLQSQFETLEIPKYGIHIDVSQHPSNIMQTIMGNLKK